MAESDFRRPVEAGSPQPADSPEPDRSIRIALGSTPLLMYALATFSDLFYEAFLLLAEVPE